MDLILPADLLGRFQSFGHLTHLSIGTSITHFICPIVRICLHDVIVLIHSLSNLHILDILWIFPGQVDPPHKIARCHEKAVLNETAINTSLKVMGLPTFSADSQDGIELLINLITFCYPNLEVVTIPTWFEDSWLAFLDTTEVDPAFWISVIQW